MKLDASEGQSEHGFKEQIIVDLEKLEDTLPKGQTVHSIRLRNDTVFLMTYQAGRFVSPIHYWNKNREITIPDASKKMRTALSLVGFWLDLDPGYSVGKSQFNYPVNFWKYNWRSGELQEIILESNQKILSFDVSPDGEVIKLAVKLGTKDRNIFYHLASGQKTSLDEMLDMNSFLWGIKGHDFVGIRYALLKEPYSKEAHDELIIGDGEGNTRNIPLLLKPGFVKFYAWINENTVLLKSANTSYKINLVSGETRPSR